MLVKSDRRLHYVCTLIWEVSLTTAANCYLKRIAIAHKAKYNDDIIDAVHKNFYMDDYLRSYRNIELTTESAVNITKFSLDGRFR